MDGVQFMCPEMYVITRDARTESLQKAMLVRTLKTLKREKHAIQIPQNNYKFYCKKN